MSAPEHRGETMELAREIHGCVSNAYCGGKEGCVVCDDIASHVNAALAAERERACPNPNEHLAGWSAKCDDFMKRAEEAQKAEKVAADSAREWSEKWHGLRKQLLEAQNLRLRAALEAAEAEIAATEELSQRRANELLGLREQLAAVQGRIESKWYYRDNEKVVRLKDALAALRDGTKP